MFLYLGSPKNIEELRADSLIEYAPDRSSIPMCVIDDEPFAYLSILANHNYNVRQYEDIDDVNLVREYEIVMCDIKGVGKAFGSKYEGAHVISLIRQRFPEKVIIAYTGHQHDASYNKYLAKSDLVLKKDADSSEWIDALEKAIAMTLNPVEKWERVRLDLIQKKVPLFDILKLEDEYTEAFMSHKNTFPRKGTLDSLPEDARAVILSLLASALFKTLAG